MKIFQVVPEIRTTVYKQFVDETRSDLRVVYLSRSEEKGRDDQNRRATLFSEPGIGGTVEKLQWG